MKRRDFLRGLGATTVLASTVASNNARASSAPVRVFVPDEDNLQYLSFWFAKAAGFFDSEFPVDVVSPPSPAQSRAWIDEHHPDVAVLPPPLYLGLISDRAPFVLGANLLANDPIDLIVRKSVAIAKGISRDLPLRERLEKLRGVKMGIAPHPPPRLRALYESAGLDANRDAEVVIVGGHRQNAAFESGQVDALYAHTPYLEQALVHQDAMLVVDQAGGEVKVLADRQIHALVFSRAFLEQRREDAVAMVRAIARAQKLIRDGAPEVTTALAKFFPKRDPAEIKLIAQLYRTAVPATPVVSVAGLAPALLFFPEGEDKPKLDGIDLATFVAPDLTRDALAAAVPRSRIEIEIATAVIVIAALAWRFRASRLRGPSADQK